jgi:hypothetical protein
MAQLPEFEVDEFKKLVHKWLTIDDNIRELKKAEKELNEQKKAITPEIIEFMSKHSIEDCNTNNREFLVCKLSTYLNNSKKSEEITEYLLGNREIEEKINLRRTFSKKE